MDFCSCLSPDMIRLSDPAHSKKKILETLAEQFASHSGLDRQLIFELLLEREKLGTTGLGKGIAVPHCRIGGIQRPLACLLRTQSGVDYDAADGVPVSLFFALLVPEDATEEHLQLLGDLAHRLNNNESVERLNRATDTTQIINVLRAPPPAA